MIIPNNILTGEFMQGKSPAQVAYDAYVQLLKIDNLNIKNILDIGCGPGRLPMGLVQNNAKFETYTGIDVKEDTINWCNQSVQDSRCKFHHIRMKNCRYNNINYEDDKELFENEDPLSNKYSLVYLYSVFSHLDPVDVKWYLDKISNCLSTDGMVYLTAFVESEFSKEYEENPVHLGLTAGNLHCCLYNKSYFEKLISDANLEIIECSHRFQEDNDGQTLYLLKTKTNN